MTINIGDEVYLTYTAFRPCAGYPVVGSAMECSGVVVNHSTTKATVNWKDGTSRTFSKEHLTLASNRIDKRCKSIW